MRILALSLLALAAHLALAVSPATDGDNVLAAGPRLRGLPLSQAPSDWLQDAVLAQLSAASKRFGPLTSTTSTGGDISDNPSADEVAAAAQAMSGTSVDESAGACEVCVYALSNKMANQPYLCRGLKSAAMQKEVRFELWSLDVIQFSRNLMCSASTRS